MDLCSKKEVKILLNKHGLKAEKKFGQNFLIDRSALKKVIEAAEINKADAVLEVGPGLGTLTAEIAKKAKKVLAVEKDDKMIEILEKTLEGIGNVGIIKQNILKLPELEGKFKVVSNLPFYLTNPIIRKFLESKNKPGSMTFIVQKEVGQRICSKPGDMSILAVSVQFYAKAELIGYISKKGFFPSPKVDSAIIRITPFKRKLPVSSDCFFKVVRAGFSQPRKQLINNLSKQLEIEKKNLEPILLKNKIKGTERAEILNLNDWINLTKSVLIN